MGTNLLRNPLRSSHGWSDFLGFLSSSLQQILCLQVAKAYVKKDCQELNLLKAEKGFPVIKTCPLALKINACPVSRQGF